MTVRFGIVSLAVLAVAQANAQSVAVAWAKGEAFGGNTTPHYAAALRNGNFVVLSTVARSGRTDGILSCYRWDGSAVWTKTIWNTDIFRPAGLHAGSSGDVFVVGSAGPAGGAQAYAARVSNTGATFWAKRFKLSAGARDDDIVDSTLDSGNNLHLTGNARRLAGLAYDQPVYLRVNANGSKGLMLFNPITPSASGGIAIRANPSGRAAVAVQTAGGSRIWVINSTVGTVYEKAVPVIDDVEAVEVNASGEVYLGGRYYNSASDSAPAVQKLGANGATLWSRWMNYAYTGNSLDTIKKVRVDSGGNIFATGVAFNHDLDFVVYKLSPAGGFLSAKLNNSATTASIDTPSFLEIGPRSDVYVAGSMVNPANSGFLATKLNSSGTYLWESYVPGSGTLDYEYRSAAFNPVTGQMLMAHHDAANSRMVLYAIRQPATATADSYLIARNSTLNGTTVFANDFYAYDGIAVPVQQPSHGTLSMNDNGTFVYTPDVGYTGIDNFSYKITKSGVSDSAAVQVVISIN